MGRPICVVFADAFAYSSYCELGGFGADYSVRKIKPGIGYSSNLHYLLFDGKTPDDVGFFTDYVWKKGQPTNVGGVRKKCDEIETLNQIYRVIRRKVSKKTDNIPFSEQDFFTYKGKYKFMEPGECTVFGRKVEKIYEHTMEESFDLAEKKIEEGSSSIVVVLETLDHLGHEVGSTDKKYMAAAQSILEHTDRLFKKFTSANSDGFCILISDHGMSEVKVNVDVLGGIRKHFGRPGKNYQIYNDSLYLRVWAEDREYLFKIKEYLDQIDCIYQISDKAREHYGATKQEYGELIYLLKEGYAFNPNCFGVAIRGGAAGLHGYMEPTDASSGILVTDILGEGTIDAMEVYRTVRSILGE